MNSPLKPPAQNNKDGTPNVGRRTSVSHAQNAIYNSDVASGRPGNRRRDSGDLLRSGNPLTSPTSRFSRDDPGITSPSTLTRRRTDIRDNGLSLDIDDRDQSTTKKEYTSPFASLKRTATGPVSAGINGPSSPWTNTPQSAQFPNTGTFGSFSMAPGSAQPTTPGEKRAGFGSLRSESRFKGLMGNDITDEARSRMKEKPSLNSLERLLESSGEQGIHGVESPRTSQSRRFPINSSHDDDLRTGSAALGGDDAVGTHQDFGSRNRPNTQASYENLGFSSLEMPSDEVRRSEYLAQARQQGQQDVDLDDPTSPTITNPYKSPQTHGENMLPRDLDLGDHEGYTGAQHPMPTRNLQTQMENMGLGDRSQTSSTGASRQFPGMGGFGGPGNLTGSGPWSAAPGSVGTLSRAYPPGTSAFGEPLLSSLDSAGIPQHQGSRFFDVGSSTPIGAPRQPEQGYSEPDNIQQRYAIAPGAGRTTRETDSPMRSSRGTLDELFTSADNRRGGPSATDQSATRSSQNSAFPPQGSFSGASMPVGTPSTATWSTNSYLGKSQDQEPPPSTGQVPNAQQRQMVMPDRMRWIYRDPTGNTQGPWSGLEMHDWYKAGFFSPELQVKKLEEIEYEPLAQLIRRIGNSREPFLVPQIGIPHGAPTSNAAAGPVGTPAVQPGPASSAQPPSAQPPFANSFPSFGTTLTAEQQNALERRKQEEQYLMARQKEHLAQHHTMAKMNMHNQQLHHHSSAHSLQSQPSYGSITSPSSYQPQLGPIQPPLVTPGFFDPARPALPLSSNMGPVSENAGSVREQDNRGFMERINAQRGGQVSYDGPFQSSNQTGGMTHQQQVNAMLQDRAFLLQQQSEQDRYNAQQRNDEDLKTQQRLEQFRALQANASAQQSEESRPISHHQGDPRRTTISDEEYEDELANQMNSDQKGRQSLSLTEQVQEAASKPAAQQMQSPWSKVPAGMPQPFPPPQSASPLPAPEPQRNRQHVADALHADLRSSPDTSSTGTPSANIAPWAKENNEASKGPSLKEIQAIEAKKAAQAEEVAAAQRKAQAEEERRNQPATIAPAPGLPSSANWASSVTPAVPVTTSSPWAKASVSSKPSATSGTATKKTLAQIQKEEEARKQRVAAQAAVSNTAAVGNAAPLVGGKRYAELAKTAPFGPQAGSNIWTTVGASGKVKTPTAVPSPVARTISGTLPTAATKAKPSSSAKQVAQDELQKWTKNALNNRLNATIAGAY